MLTATNDVNAYAYLNYWGPVVCCISEYMQCVCIAHIEILKVVSKHWSVVLHAQLFSDAFI